MINMRRGLASAQPAEQRCPPQKTTRPIAMINPMKMRQAGMIVFATTVILILPNLTRLVS
jgi:hypothetical protein